MNTEEIIEIDEVQEAQPTSGLIKFDIARADIERMATQAEQAIITGPDDKAGYKHVFATRQVVKKQRIAVESKAKELKAPHTAYNRQVDAAMKELTDQMEAIEDGLAHKEKVYNDERERIAREKMLAQQQRTEGRVNALREFGFVWDARTETYNADFICDELPDGRLAVNFDDIKELSDEDYQPTLEMVRGNYENHQRQIAERKRLADEEAARIAEQQRIETERLAEERRQLEEQKAELKRQQDEIQRKEREAEEKRIAQQWAQRVERLMAVGFVEDGPYFVFADIRKGKSTLGGWDDDDFDEFINDARDHAHQLELDRLESEAIKEAIRKQAIIDEKAKNKADKARQKRFKSDKAALLIYFGKICGLNVPTLENPESLDLHIAFEVKLKLLIDEFRQSAEAL